MRQKNVEIDLYVKSTILPMLIHRVAENINTYLPIVFSHCILYLK